MQEQQAGPFLQSQLCPGGGKAVLDIWIPLRRLVEAIKQTAGPSPVADGDPRIAADKLVTVRQHDGRDLKRHSFSL